LMKSISKVQNQIKYFTSYTSRSGILDIGSWIDKSGSWGTYDGSIDSDRKGSVV
jgi:hypothetical protein